MLSNRFGGIGQAYLDYNAALLSRGHEVQAICHGTSVWNELTQKQQAQYSNLTSHFVYHKGGPLALWSAFKIRRALAKFRPDAIIIHNYLRLGLLACQGAAPLVSVTHMYKSRHFEKLDGVIALTNELAERCVKNGIQKDKIHIVPNMIEGPFIPHRPRQRAIPVIGGLGRLDIVKGYQHLIDAIKTLKDRNVAYKLVLGGTGFEEANLRAQVARLGLEADVEFAGYISDKAAFFERIDIFSIPSTNEPFGITVLEGMKYGKPLVVSNVGGPAEILENETHALLVPAGESAGLADALQRLIQEPETAAALARNATDLVSTRYSIPEVSAHLIAALESTLRTSR